MTSCRFLEAFKWNINFDSRNIQCLFSLFDFLLHFVHLESTTCLNIWRPTCFCIPRHLHSIRSWWLQFWHISDKISHSKPRNSYITHNILESTDIQSLKIFKSQTRLMIGFYFEGVEWEVRPSKPLCFVQGTQVVHSQTHARGGSTSSSSWV